MDFGREEDEAARHGGEGGADHACGVFLGDGEDGERSDDRLAEVDAGQAELGGVLAAPGSDVDAGGDRGADTHRQDDGPDKQPAGAGQGAQLGPLGAQRVGHASLRRTRMVATPRASAA